MTIRILIVDEHSLYRKGVAVSCASERDLTIVGEAENGDHALALSDTYLPDVILVDADLGGDAGIELTRNLKRRHPQTGVLVLSARFDDEQLFQAIRAGAAAYVAKDIDAAGLADLIRRVARGDYVINESVLSRPHVASRVLNQFREISELDESTDGVFSPLTPREIEILDRVAQGNSNKEIAYGLGISDQTVKNHITSILRKLAVNDRTQAVIYALRQGWIKLEDYGEPDQRSRR